MINKIFITIGALRYLIFAGILITGCSAADKNNDIIKLHGSTMGTTYNIQFVNDVESINKDTLLHETNDILNSIDRLMSTWRSDSELSQINNQPVDKWITASPDTLYVLELALSVSQKTKGAFDVTLAPLIELWGFASHEMKTSIPNKESIKFTLQKVGYEKLEIDHDRGMVIKRMPVRIDLSAIAKGYAVDKIAEHFDNKGIKAYLIEVGGEIRLRGKKSNVKHWKIAIETPLVDKRKAFQVLNITNHAIATSGDYRNYYEINGEHYSHTIDPNSGYPVIHGLASVTVIGETAAYADAVATALMVMGPDKAYQFCEENKISAYFIIKQNKAFVSRYTSYMKKYLAKG